MMETELSWLLRSGNEKDQGRLLKWTIPSLDPGVWGLELRNGWGPRGGDVANSRCMSSGPPVIRCWMDSGLLDVRRWQRRRSLWMARQEPAGRTTNWDAVLTEPLPAWPWTAEPRWHTDALVTLLCALSVWRPSGKSRPSPQMLWWILKALFLEAVSSLNSALSWNGKFFLDRRSRWCMSAATEEGRLSHGKWRQGRAPASGDRGSRDHGPILGECLFWAQTRLTPEGTPLWPHPNHDYFKSSSIYHFICKYLSKSISEVVSNSLQLHGLYSTWNSPGQNTGVGRL